ncbi:hypothetical protein [Ornithinimicrobium sp. Y1694]|uniref:hypothetical protein n=1 Tax=Ornithinimicrobium sp. Y1694 TaxID=3418590 RepID=UPI003CEE92BB
MSYQPAPGMHEPGHQPGAAQAPAKPQSIRLAELLMYAGAVVTLIGGLAGLFGDRDAIREAVRTQLEATGQTVTAADLDTAVSFSLVTTGVLALVFAGLWVLMARLNAKGIGWARIVATILGAIGIINTVMAVVASGLMPGTAAGGVIGLILQLITGAIAVAVLVLLWRQDSNSFFAARARR